MNEYEAKRQARVERYRRRAEQAQAEAQALNDGATKMAEVIPLGQPILIGHHSEKSDRRYRERIENKFRRAAEARAKAKHYEQRARAAEKNRAISSDDPEAVRKLRSKLASLEAKQRLMKAINAAWRKAGQPSPDDCAGWQRVADDSSVMMNINDLRHVRDDMAKRKSWGGDASPFPGYSLRNLNANIRRIRERIEELEKRAEGPEAEPFEGEGFRISEDPDWGRILIEFDAKPPDTVRQYLKSHGWRWAPSRCAWVCHLNARGRTYAQLAAEKLPELL